MLLLLGLQRVSLLALRLRWLYMPTTSIKSTVSGSYSFSKDSSSVKCSTGLKSDRIAAPAWFRASENRLAVPFPLAMLFDTGTRRGSPVDEGSRSIRTLGRCCVVRTDFTFRPTATTGFCTEQRTVAEEEGGSCDGPG